MQFMASATIAASAQDIWAILVNTAAYPEWDPHCDRIEGQVALNAKLKAYTKMAPGRAFGVKVSVLDAPHRMVWSGGMPLGLFGAERSFILEPQDEGRTRVTVREDFSGLLLPLIGRTVPDLQPSFDGFVAGLKARAEG